MGNDELELWLHGQIEGFAAAVDGLDPELRVPTCPQWRVRDLVGHIGQAFRWAAGLVREGGPAPVPDPVAADPGPPAQWRDWLLAGAAELVDAVEQADGTPVWTFFGEQPPRFWLRRMLNDLVVHHFDAANTAGREFAVNPELAAETISEGLELITRPEAAALVPGLAELGGSGQRLAVRPVDGPSGWLITRAAAGARWEREAAGQDGSGRDGSAQGESGPVADVVLAGPTRELLLVLTRRLDAQDPRVTVTGDRELLAHWLARVAY